MDIRYRKTRKAVKRRAAEYLNDVEKNQLAIRAVVAKRKLRLVASKNALRVVERSNGEKLIQNKPRPRR